jgi:hypothetical protein
MTVSSIRGARRTSMGLVLAAAVAAAGIAPAYAQTADLQAKTGDETFSAAHLQLAQQAVNLSKSAGAFDDILPVLANQTKALFLRSNPALAKDIEEVTQQVALSLAVKRRDLDRVIQEVWARRFSEDELKEIIAFYQSPVGAKLADLSPTIVALSVGAAKEWSDEISTLLVTQVREEMQKRGHQL